MMRWIVGSSLKFRLLVVPVSWVEPEVPTAGGPRRRGAGAPWRRAAPQRAGGRPPGVHAATGGHPDRSAGALGGRGGAARHRPARAGPAQRGGVARPDSLPVASGAVADRADLPA